MVGSVAVNGKRSGNAVRAGVRRSQIPHARNLYAEIGGPSIVDRNTPNDDLHILESKPSIARRIGVSHLRRRSVRLGANPLNLRLRSEFRDAKIPASAEHREPGRLHIGSGAYAPHFHDVGGVVRVPLGDVGGGAGAEFVMVDHRGGAVRVFVQCLEKPQGWD
ncbi:hypothetical protein ACS0TY_011588 [Phlomoides rotata]